MTLPSGTPIGRYLVRRKLAEGGMAEIYLCAARGPEGFEKEVVIKRVRSFVANDPDFVRMFIAEAQLASKLNHANIVQIFDFEKHQDTYYLAMEYVRGHSLWDVRKRCRELMVPIPPTLAAHIGAEVARGLHYAHSRSSNGRRLGIVHRDVSPHNILLSFDGAVKLTDFGIAKAGTQISSPGMLKGKIAYMSPEQSRGREVDARSDLFALGIVLWELLTGGRLFDADNDVAMLRAVQRSVIPSPARLNADVTPELDAIVTKALQRALSKRFQSALEMERALAQYVLSHAQRIEDADVAVFLRRIFAEETSGSAEELPSVSVSIDTPIPGPEPVPPALVDPQEASTLPEDGQVHRNPNREGPRQDNLTANRLSPGAGEHRRRLIIPLGVGTGLLMLGAFWLGIRPSAPVHGSLAEPAPVESAVAAEEAPPEPRPPESGSGRAAPGQAESASDRGVAPKENVQTDSSLGSAEARGEGSEPPPAREKASLTPQKPGPGSLLAHAAPYEAEAKGTGTGRRPAVEKASLAHKKPRPGSLVVHATPYATVFADDKKLGDADPLGIFTLSGRRHRIRLVYKTTTYETDVNLASGEAKISRNFLPQP